MRVLILSVTAGYGHHAAAITCEEEFTERGWHTARIDLLKETNILYYHLVDKGYSLSIKLIPRLYAAVFHRSARRHALKPRTLTSRFVRMVTRRTVRRLIKEHAPDAVLCTHVLGAMAMDGLKERGEKTPPVYGLITDYDIHPFWEDTRSIEHILTAHPWLKPKAERRGINTRQLVPTGIPAAKRYYTRHVPPPEKPFCVLYMSGSMGFGDIADTVAELSAIDGVHILCVCGNNERARAKVEAMARDNVEVFGFVDNIDELMDRAHCIITKPGGLSTTEALLKKLPMVLVNPIPGQEERNAEFLCGMGTAVLTTRDFPPSDAVNMLRNSDGRFAEMRAAAARALDGCAAKKIADLILAEKEERTPKL